MKSIFFKTLAFCFLALSLWSCKKDETQTVSVVGTAGTLTASTTALNLVQANGAQTAVTLSYPLATSSGYVVPVNTTLQFALKGTNFAAPKEIVVTTKTYAPTVTEINNMILALGGKIGVAAQVEVRLKSGAAVNDLTYSNIITLSATPYLASAWIYVPGNYQGWNPATADSLVSLTSNGIYIGIIKFDGSNFKITPEKKWDVAYGDAGGGAISTSGGDIASGVAGLKQVTVNLTAKTIKIEDTKVWAVIGDATPGKWDTDTDMKFINDGKGTWKVTTNLTAGSIKFRQDHKWDVNLGGSGGNLTAGGADIAVAAAGNYTITLDVTGSKYTLVKN
ncbi:SusE domain-containing protein [Pedobacter soli]|uniref:SusE outer membrane protein n=1 Tax=Pedobacter soli TaxID=390242 RepID=A0A1G7BSA5_9SPHI|nr:SusE domain-containing protein [Pedobacter soli]SDE29530.1 SusE outer membrane protein [Pedobacter soli]